MAERKLRQPLISREALERVRDARLAEASVLLAAHQFAGAVYLAGYAVECQLKVAICARLDWESLRGTFKIHDLPTLLLYTGLEKELQANAPVWRSFNTIAALWNDKDGSPTIRYQGAGSIDEETATKFMDCIQSKTKGVIPWLQKAMS